MTAAADERRDAEFGEGLIAALGFLALAAVNLILWPVDYPPLVDLPNHLARHAIQCDPAIGLGRYYDYGFVWVPNLTAELIHALPMACASLLTTQQVLIQLATTGLLASVLMLHFAVWRRWSVWPLLAAFASHHMAFAYG
ncbi:MAG: hypothetical protein HKP29_12090, partial [Silicimonas sp.]|nr:hypothetical protein [Silicimonas sp.]